MPENILEVRNLKKYFKTPSGLLHAVDGVSFSIEKGKTLGLVGESGCGKSTIGRLVIGLLEATEGEILFEGHDICTMDKAQLHSLRKDVQIIFQDPFASLNPRMTISEIISEPLMIYRTIKSKNELTKRVEELMDVVGLSQRLFNSYPHELDGGRRQRVGIARALSLMPKFIVCDEPVSSLDVSIQAQILNLLKELQQEFGLTFLFITHDLSVVKYFSDNIAVMYLGQMVETAPSDLLFQNTLHPYSQALLSAIPEPNIHKKMHRVKLIGELSSPINPEPGCRFSKRCPYAAIQCNEKSPELKLLETAHFCACTRVEELQNSEMTDIDENFKKG